MKAFHTIAVPHDDILQGRLTLDVFAADLWEVCQNRGPDEYKDADMFFQKTYLTEGLNHLLQIVEKRLRGQGGDPVIQIQTPFGGGKTHTLIAMYHRAKQWQAKPVVIDGSVLGKGDTLWGFLEKQLTGSIDQMAGQTAPGREAIRQLLAPHGAVLILMDEVLAFVTKAAGVSVGDSNLASQTIAFMMELTKSVSTLSNVSLVITLPSSDSEHFDKHAEKLYQKLQDSERLHHQLQKVSGRIEKVYTPVQDHEITQIIRQRLFSHVDDGAIKETVGAVVDYAVNNGILPADSQPSEYKQRFMASFPFLPEVIDVLYHMWGTFPTFQRTRGVLRLLSLVIYSLRDSQRPYLSMADFDLKIQDIRQELVKHIGAEFNSVIDADISGKNAGAVRIDESLGNAYRGLRLGTRTATAIFMNSFSGGAREPGITIGEIKRLATTLDNPASIVSEAIEQLKHKLFYLQNPGDKYFFNKQANLNRILLTRMENIPDDELAQREFELIRGNCRGDHFQLFIWKTDSADIPDTDRLKLVILPSNDSDVIQQIMTTKGQSPRVHKNTLYFLCPMESERIAFLNKIRRVVAYERIQRDPNLNLTDDQKKDVQKGLKDAQSDLNDLIQGLYRQVIVPDRNGVRPLDMGKPMYGVQKGLDGEVYEELRSHGRLLERIAPIVLKEKYLKGNEYVLTEKIFEASLNTPGETGFVSKTVLEEGIRTGVVAGLFGLGELDGETIHCRFFKQSPSVAVSGQEIMIAEAICEEQTKPATPAASTDDPVYPEPTDEHTQPGIKKEATPDYTTGRDRVTLRFAVPKGKVSSIMGVMNLLQLKFDSLAIEITATGGQISDQDYEDKIMETFRQLGIEVG